MDYGSKGGQCEALGEGDIVDVLQAWEGRPLISREQKSRKGVEGVYVIYSPRGNLFHNNQENEDIFETATEEC